MDTANGTLYVGQKAQIIAGENKGKRGTITHLYTSGVMVGLVVIDDRIVAEGVDVLTQPTRLDVEAMIDYASDPG